MRLRTNHLLVVLMLSLPLLAPATAPAAVIDYLFQYNAISYNSDLNGIGQTFTAQDPFLADASLLMAHPVNPTYAWWTGGHFEVRSGSPGAFDGSDGNVLFRSGTIDFEALPQVGVAWDGSPVYELALRAHGLAHVIPTQVGQTYSLVLVDDGNSGYINVAEFFQQVPGQPAYSGGVAVFHGRYDPSPDFHETGHDLAFRVVGVPEPAGASLTIAALTLACRRKRRPAPRAGATRVTGSRGPSPRSG